MRYGWAMRSLALFLLAVAACGGTAADTTLRLDDYATVCNADSECVAVFIGDPCTSPCRCSNAAINGTSYHQQASDLAAAEALCTSKPACSASCTNPKPSCVHDACALP